VALVSSPRPLEFGQWLALISVVVTSVKFTLFALCTANMQQQCSWMDWEGSRDGRGEAGSFQDTPLPLLCVLTQHLTCLRAQCCDDDEAAAAA